MRALLERLSSLEPLCLREEMVPRCDAEALQVAPELMIGLPEIIRVTAGFHRGHKLDAICHAGKKCSL